MCALPDTDGDGVNDACDNCPNEANEPTAQAPGVCTAGLIDQSCVVDDDCDDLGDDGVCSQADGDDDGIGDACDLDESIVLEYTYDGLNRPVDITRNDTQLIHYDYDGLEMTGRTIRTEYVDRHTAWRTAGKVVNIRYEPEYDDHGRITKISNISETTDGTTPTAEHVLAMFDYTYDNAGNRLTDEGASAANSGFARARDIAYAYDTLHRVNGADYDDTAPTDVTFDYDSLGNREEVVDGLNNVTRGYTANSVNEYTQVSADAVTQSVTYDNKGNLSQDEGYDDDGDDRFGYTYDIENRLVQVGYDDDNTGDLTVLADYVYDAHGRKVEYIDRTNSVTTRYIYDGDNVIVETDATGATQRAYMHGKQYIDERAVMRTYDTEAEDHYYLLKDLYTVTGLAKDNGALAEAYVYDAYGEITMYAWPATDLNRDGNVNVLDQAAVNLVRFTMNDASADINDDGNVNILDLAAVNLELFRDPPPELTYSGLGNPYFFTGREVDALEADDVEVSNDTDGFRRIQHNRNRSYDAKHGRWLQRDPIGYVDGMNLYDYAGGMPANMVDPRGTQYWDTAPKGPVSASITAYWGKAWSDVYITEGGKTEIFEPFGKETRPGPSPHNPEVNWRAEIGVRLRITAPVRQCSTASGRTEFSDNPMITAKQVRGGDWSTEVPSLVKWWKSKGEEATGDSLEGDSSNGKCVMCYKIKIVFDVQTASSKAAEQVASTVLDLAGMAIPGTKDHAKNFLLDTTKYFGKSGAEELANIVTLNP